MVATYLANTSLVTFAMALVWGINTLFLMEAGLDIFQVMLVNACYAVGQIVFEVPTGVVADTIGRRISFVAALALLLASTGLFVAAARLELGVWALGLASVQLGLGYTFHTGSIEAWAVDALRHVGAEASVERVLAWGMVAYGTSALAGTACSGLLGQIDLALPYYVRMCAFAACMWLVWTKMRDVGFQPRPLTVRSFLPEARRVFVSAIGHGWKHRVVRPLLAVSLVHGVFFLFGFYSWQRYALDLLGRDLVWVAAATTSLFAMSGVVGGLLVIWLRRTDAGRTDGATGRFLGAVSAAQAALVLCAALVGLLMPESSRGTHQVLAAVTPLLAFGVLVGVATPVRRAYINSYIPSERRATVLSLDSMFYNLGGALGQPGLGWVARSASIPLAWAVGACVTALAWPLYMRAAANEAGAKRACGDGSVPSR